jgi:O-antigen/teichoic acid export membrane protein
MSEPAEVPVSGADLVLGGAHLLGAKVVAVLAGFGLYWGLALAFSAALGEVAGTAALGVWGATFGIVNPISAMALAGTLQVMSRFVARAGHASAFRSAARAQLLLVGGVFFGLQLSAGWIAGSVLNDPSYTEPLRLAAWIPVFYAWRALYEGYLNGLRRFREQALLDIAATLLRAALILVGAVVGASALGAIGGFVAAALGMALVAEVWIRPERGAAAQPLRELWLFQAQVIGVTLATQYLLYVDLIGVKALASDVPAVADRLAGYYTAAQRIAQVPLSVVAAFPYLMFSYVAAGDRDVARVVRLGLRALLLVIAPAAVLLASNAHETLLLVFPSLGRTLATTGDPASAFSGPLAALALGYVPFSLLLTSTTLLNAGGRPGLVDARSGRQRARPAQTHGRFRFAGECAANCDLRGGHLARLLADPDLRSVAARRGRGAGPALPRAAVAAAGSGSRRARARRACRLARPLSPHGPQARRPAGRRYTAPP